MITTFALSSILDKKWLSLQDLMSCTLAVLGLALIFGVNILLSDNYLGLFLAFIAGIGYGTFLTISPRFNVGSGLLVGGVTHCLYICKYRINNKSIS